jgi:hypothetical protein
MKSRTIAIAAFAGLLSFGGAANAKGCLTGAAVGGAAGHFAGHHSLIGAGVGCAIGRHRANKKDREAAAAQSRAQTAPAQGYTSTNATTNTAPVKR